MIKLVRKCRRCDDGVGKVNGEYVHVNGNYCCQNNKGTVAE